jgi:hypothetical protein
MEEGLKLACKQEKPRLEKIHERNLELTGNLEGCVGNLESKINILIGVRPTMESPEVKSTEGALSAMESQQQRMELLLARLEEVYRQLNGII